MLERQRIDEILSGFGIRLDSPQIGQLSAYLALLLRWNEKINLTAICNAEECLTRHFGESLFLASFEKLEGRVLDVGSGAGFPGLALKIMFPSAGAVLLEPVAKKRAFLKEVVRVCAFHGVEIRRERLSEFAGLAGNFNAITMRAVGGFPVLLPDLSRALGPEGKLHLWMGRDDANHLAERSAGFDWIRRTRIPLSEKREILTGIKATAVEPDCGTPE